MVTHELSTRERILQAAEPLFAKGGFTGVSMRAIAAAGGVHLGQLPYHFGTKEALYREIWVYWISQVEADDLLSEMGAPAHASRKEQLRAVVEAFFDGPGRMLRHPRGRHFVAIMTKEVNDPTAPSRGLLEEFIYPNGDRFKDELARLFPEMDSAARDAGFEMIIAALRAVIERGQSSVDGQPNPSEAAHLFRIFTKFIVEGWMGISENPRNSLK